MSRHPLVLALALAALLPASAFAEDLLQTYDLARTGDPQLAAAESSRLAQKEGAVQARAALLPQINGSASLSRSRTDSDGRQLLDDGTIVNGNVRIQQHATRDYGVNLYADRCSTGAAISNLRSQRALSHAADFDLESAGDSLITRTSAAYFNVLVAIETLAAAEAAETALKRQFDYADKRLEVGLAPITDVHEARAQYDSARANTIAQRNAAAGCLPGTDRNHRHAGHQSQGLAGGFPSANCPTDAGCRRLGGIRDREQSALKSLEYQVQSAEADVSTARAGHSADAGPEAPLRQERHLGRQHARSQTACDSATRQPVQVAQPDPG